MITLLRTYPLVPQKFKGNHRKVFLSTLRVGLINRGQLTLGNGMVEAAVVWCKDPEGKLRFWGRLALPCQLPGPECGFSFQAQSTKCLGGSRLCIQRWGGGTLHISCSMNNAISPLWCHHYLFTHLVAKTLPIKATPRDLLRDFMLLKGQRTKYWKLKGLWQFSEVTEKMVAKLNHQKKAGTVQNTLSKLFTKK